MTDWKSELLEHDSCLCMDDYFPKCDGTRTHPLKLSQILSISEVSQALEKAYDRGWSDCVDNTKKLYWGDNKP